MNAYDLRAVVTAELKQLRAELRTTDTTPWKRYWNVDSESKVTRPLIENECRDHLLDRLRDRLKKYQIAAALPEARRGAETRADVLMLTGAGRNSPSRQSDIFIQTYGMPPRLNYRVTPPPRAPMA